MTLKYAPLLSPAARLLAATGLLALSSTMAQATPLGNWLTVGDVSQAYQLGAIDLAGHAYLLGTASLDFADDAPLAAGALNLSGNNPGDIGSLTSAMGVSGTLFDDDTNGHYAYEGSALFSAPLNVQAGDTLSFDWRLFSQVSTGPIPVPDAAWLVLGNTAIKLADVGALSTVNSGWLDSGSQHLTRTFTQSGSVRIGFVVADVDSYDTSSVLALQNIQLTAAVPEPDSLLLVLTGVLLLGHAARKRGAAAHQS